MGEGNSQAILLARRTRASDGLLHESRGSIVAAEVPPVFRLRLQVDNRVKYGGHTQSPNHMAVN